MTLETGRVNYFLYLGISPDASDDEIKEAIKAKESSFALDGISKQDIVKVMLNEDLRNNEKETYLEKIKENDIHNEDMDDKYEEGIRNVVCWNCGKEYEFDEEFDEGCPYCNAEESKTTFNKKVAQLEDCIDQKESKGKLMFVLKELKSQYAKSEDCVATSILNELEKKIEGCPSLNEIHKQINDALDQIELCCKTRRIYTGYGIYLQNKALFESEGIITDNRISTLIEKHRICNDHLLRIREAERQKDLSMLLILIAEIKNHTVDCSEVDEIMEKITIPSVSDLKVVENNHSVQMFWNYAIDGVYFSVYKTIDDGEAQCIATNLTTKSYSYIEHINGAKITYSVWAHFESLRSAEGPSQSIMIFDNVHALVENRVSGAISFHWNAPANCAILVAKQENAIPTNWENAELVDEVSREGFVDRNVKPNCKYGYKIKCVYETQFGKVESAEITIDLCSPNFEFMPLSVISQNVDLYENQWCVNYYPLILGTPVFYKSYELLHISRDRTYTVHELENMKMLKCTARIGESSASLSLEQNEKAYYYSGSIYNDMIYLNEAVQINSFINIHNLHVENIGGANKTIKVKFTWGEKSRSIIILDGDGHYYEKLQTLPIMWFKDKTNPGEDALVANLNSDRESHYISIFEIDELGKEHLILKLDPITNRTKNLEYKIETVQNEARVTLFFSNKFKIDGLCLCQVFPDGEIKTLYGPLELEPKVRFFRKAIAKFTYEEENLSFKTLTLRFDKNKTSKVFKINGFPYLIQLKER